MYSGKVIEANSIPIDKYLQENTLTSGVVTYTLDSTYTSPTDKLLKGTEMNIVFTSRRKRLLQLIQTKFDNNQTKFADAVGRSNAYVSFLLADPSMPHSKNLGEKLAAHIETTLGLPDKWLDGGNDLELSEGKIVTLNTANEGMYEMIPRRILKLSAGDGDPVFESDETAPPLAFRKEWLLKEGLKPKDLVVAYAKGSSMEPRIFDGDTLLINTADKGKALQDNKIYALRYGDEIRVKRIIRKMNSVLLVSDNSSYPDEEVTLDESDQLQVLGRIVWISGTV